MTRTWFALTCILAFSCVETRAAGKKEEQQARSVPGAPAGLLERIFSFGAPPSPTTEEKIPPLKKGPAARPRQPKARAASVPVPAEKIVMSLGAQTLTETQFLYIAQAITACVRTKTDGVKRGDSIDCLVREGDAGIEYTLTKACSEHELCLRAVITQEWCRGREGVWKIGETQWICEPKP